MLLFSGKLKVDKVDTFIPHKHPIIVSPLQLGEWIVKIEDTRASAQWSEAVAMSRDVLVWKEIGEVETNQMSFGLVLAAGKYRVRVATHPETQQVIMLVWDAIAQPKGNRFFRI
jgi:hypothetical protein